MLAWLALTAVLAASQAPMVLTQAFWSGQQPESPRLPAAGPSLDFVLRPATGAGVPTLALLAAARMPGPIAEAYGARAPGATQIVAVDSATGAVFSRPAEREGSAPFADVGPRRKEPHAGGATIDSIEVWFNADLRSHLDLPSDAKTYSVFLWVDQMTSPLRLARLPASGKPATPASPPAIETKGLHFRKSRLSPKPPDRGLALRVSRNATIYGAVDTSGISEPSFILTVLALDSSTRELSSRSLRVSSQHLKSSAGAFDFDFSALFPPPQSTRGGRAAFFVAVVIPCALSNVVAVQ